MMAQQPELTPIIQPTRWQIIEKATPDSFKVDLLGLDPAGRYSPPPCEVAGCNRHRLNTRATLCRVHDRQFKESGRELQKFLRLKAENPAENYAKTRLDGQGDTQSNVNMFELSAIHSNTLRIELTYGLSVRALGGPDYAGPVRPISFNTLARALMRHRVYTLGQVNSDLYDIIVAEAGSKRSHWASILRHTKAAISLLIRESPDVRVALGRRRGGSTRFSRHQEITLPWMREAVQRFTQMRLNAEQVSAQHAGQQESHLVTFAAWCEANYLTIPEHISRHVLLDWMGHVNGLVGSDGEQFSPVYRSSMMGAVDQFLSFCRTDLNIPVPESARYRPGERPHRPDGAPRYLEANIIAVLKSPEALAMVDDPAHRLIIQIMMDTGMRIGHTCSLEKDCLRNLNPSGSGDKWALQYMDTKSSRSVQLPISPDLAEAIRRFVQNDRDAAVESQLLFSNSRAWSTNQVSPEAVSRTIEKWVHDLQLKNPYGDPLRITAHQFRHTFATSLLEKDVALDVVQKLLGHRNIASTQIYATVTDARLREQWERAQLVDVVGNAVSVPKGPDGDTEWLLHRIGQAMQPLPNGYCTLPIQKKCPHANVCLDGCDNFVTSPDFLPTLLAQRDEHERFISEAESRGHLRIVEINSRPRDNLNRIISTLKGEESGI